MDGWPSILSLYAEELREIRWLGSVATRSDDAWVVAPSSEPVFLEHEFWSKRTHEVESSALEVLTNAEIDRIFEDVAAVLDANLDHFKPVIDYFGRFYPDPSDGGIRMDHETEMAHSIERDLAWIAVERVIDRTGFFSNLLEYYARGRWPCGWIGPYPEGHLQCL